MALSRVTTWAKQTLTFQALNAEFDNILSNAMALISPMTDSLDMNGKTIIIDVDADTSITGATDDRIAFTVGGNTMCTFTLDSAEFPLTKLELDLDLDTSIRSATDDIITLAMSGTDLFVFNGAVTTPVNGLTFRASATGSAASIEAVGSDSNIGITLTPKGTGVVNCAGGISSTGLLTGTVYNGSVTRDLGSLANGATETFNITVTGAEVGDFVMVSRGADLSGGMTTTGVVSTANTVTVCVTNHTGGTVDAASTTYYARVLSRT